MGKPKGKKIGKWMLLALAAVLVVCAGFVGSSLLTERPAVAVMSVYQETFADTVITEETDGAVEIFPTADDRIENGSFTQAFIECHAGVH